MTIGDRIREAREAAGYTQEQLADLLNVKQQSVQQWESGDTQRPKKINEIASLLAVSVDYLLNGEESIIDFPYPLASRCPLVNWDDAVNWPKNRSELKKESKLTYPASHIVLRGNCFMLKIEDNSMVSHMEAKGFHKDKYIIVDPSRSYENGSFIVATKNNMKKLLFRQYINDGENEYITPLNLSHYKRIDMSSGIKIRGIVIAYLELFP